MQDTIEKKIKEKLKDTEHKTRIKKIQNTGRNKKQNRLIRTQGRQVRIGNTGKVSIEYSPDEQSDLLHGTVTRGAGHR